MAEPRAADGVAPSDLGSYQYAVRLVLTNDLITAARPRIGALGSVLRWADLIARDFAELLGYTLIATAHQVRLLRRLDTLDATQRSVFTARSGRPFDRRRLAYLCLVLAVFQRSRIEISLADLVRSLAPAANAINGLGFDATITEHKRATLDVETATALRGSELTDNLARLTGLVVERRAEGVLLVDPTGRFSDQAFPGRGGAVNRAAGLMLAKIADVMADPDDGPALTRIPVPSAAEDLCDLLARIGTGMVSGQADPDRAVRPADADPLEAPFIDRTRLERMLDELYEHFGPASFTTQWQYDRRGMLDAATRLLDDLRLIRRMPGGAAILPAAARYRNITAALPAGGRREGQGMLDFSGGPS